MHHVNRIGSDVRAARLSAVSRNHRDQQRSAPFDNDPAGHRKLIAWRPWPCNGSIP